MSAKANRISRIFGIDFQTAKPYPFQCMFTWIVYSIFQVVQSLRKSSF